MFWDRKDSDGVENLCVPPMPNPIGGPIYQSSLTKSRIKFGVKMRFQVGLGT